MNATNPPAATAKQYAPNAARISAVLAAAGFQRASKYSPWGRAQDGFAVSNQWTYVSVDDTTDPYGRSHYIAGPADGRVAERMALMCGALAAAGYNAQVVGRKQHPSIEVRPWDPRMSLWQAPSGHLHWARGCSGGAGRRMVRVLVTEEAFLAAERCRCAQHWVSGAVAR